MELIANDENSDSIIWLPHGKAFVIKKKEKFASQVLPVYFKQSKFTSFTRKLNRWGFSRITSGPDAGAFYHKYFQRDSPKLCLQMSCHNPGAQLAASQAAIAGLKARYEHQIAYLSMFEIPSRTTRMEDPMLMPYLPTNSILASCDDYIDTLNQTRSTTRPLLRMIQNSLMEIEG